MISQLFLPSPALPLFSCLPKAHTECNFYNGHQQQKQRQARPASRPCYGHHGRPLGKSVYKRRAKLRPDSTRPCRAPSPPPLHHPMRTLESWPPWPMGTPESPPPPTGLPMGSGPPSILMTRDGPESPDKGHAKLPRHVITKFWRACPHLRPSTPPRHPLWQCKKRPSPLRQRRGSQGPQRPQTNALPTMPRTRRSQCPLLTRPPLFPRVSTASAATAPRATARAATALSNGAAMCALMHA